MRPSLNYLLGISLLAGGCTTFQHQTSETEPHAVIRFIKPPGASGDSRMIRQLNGVPVSRGKDYRVTPGRHVVVIAVTSLTTETYHPHVFHAGSDGRYSGPVKGQGVIDVSQAGQASASGFNPSGGTQMASLRTQARRTTYLTNFITVEAGWSYELDGYKTRKFRQPH